MCVCVCAPVCVCVWQDRAEDLLRNGGVSIETGDIRVAAVALLHDEQAVVFEGLEDCGHNVNPSLPSPPPSSSYMVLKGRWRSHTHNTLQYLAVERGLSLSLSLSLHRVLSLSLSLSRSLMLGLSATTYSGAK